MIPLFKVFSAPEIIDNLKTVFDSGFIGQGETVDQFEDALRQKLDSEYVVTTNSATSAEHLVFYILKKFYGLESGDEVLTTALTCSATNTPIILNDLKVKWVDIDPKSMNIDLLDLERKISPSTKVIYITHWGGTPVNMDKVLQLRDKTYKAFGFYPYILQDCAHAFGATWDNKELSNYGLCTYSFQAIKHLTTVDGGAIVFNTWEDFNKQARLLRWYGIDRDDKRRVDFRCESDLKNAGFKFHMNNVSASVGLSNLKYIDWILQRHRVNACWYDTALCNLSGIELMERDYRANSSYWIYSMLVEDRVNFMKKMKDKGIITSQVHERNDKHTCFKDFKTFLPNLDSIIGKLVHIPVGWWVTEEDREYIIETIKQGW